jgi:hypothetical protein
MEQWEPVAALFDEPGGQLLVEKKLAIAQNFIPAKWDTAWGRGIIDVAILQGEKAKAYDWKTGKVKPDSLQLRLFSALLMHTYGFVEEVKTGYVWLQDGTITEETYTRDSLPEFWAEYLPKIKRWEESYQTNTWEKRPSGLCAGWCSNRECNFHKEKKP